MFWKTTIKQNVCPDPGWFEIDLIPRNTRTIDTELLKGTLDYGKFEKKYLWSIEFIFKRIISLPFRPVSPF